MVGYKTDDVCWMCGKKPALIEPRFNYARCEVCDRKYTPIDFNYAPYTPKHLKF